MKEVFVSQKKIKKKGENKKNVKTFFSFLSPWVSELGPTPPLWSVKVSYLQDYLNGESLQLADKTNDVTDSLKGWPVYDHSAFLSWELAF